MGVSALQESDGLGGALLHALAAADALLRVNPGEVVFQRNGPLLALLHADAAADTTGGADLLDQSALVLVGAADGNLGGAVVHSDDALGAGLGAQAAAHAHTGIDHGNAIPDGDGTLGTHADAVFKQDH